MEYSVIILLQLSLIDIRYIKHPNEANVTREFVESGNYEIEAMGKRYPVNLRF